MFLDMGKGSGKYSRNTGKSGNFLREKVGTLNPV